MSKDNKCMDSIGSEVFQCRMNYLSTEISQCQDLVNPAGSTL